MPDSNILTTILGAIVNGASAGFSDIKSYAERLFYSLLIIEIVLLGFGFALGRVDFQRELVGKILAVGFVQFLLFRYVWLVDGLRDGFVSLGLMAGGANLRVPEFLDPSAFASLGFDRVSDVLKAQEINGVFDLLSAIDLSLIFYLLAIIIMFFAFIGISLTIFLLVIEFYVISSLAVIFIPFLVLEKTNFIGQRAIISIISVAVKLMSVAFVASISWPALDFLSFPDQNPTINQGLSVATGALAIACLMWKAPQLGLSLVSNVSGLDVNSTFFQPTLSAANNAGSLAFIGKGATNKGASLMPGVASAVMQGARYVKNFRK